MKLWFVPLAAAVLLIGGCAAAPEASTPAATTATTTTVPDLIGLAAAQVSPQLQAANLTLGPTTYAPSSEPVDTVIAATPAAGTTVATGTAISVVLSQGPPAATQAPVAAQPAVAKPGTALAALAGLRTAGRGPKTGYARSEFGTAWYDVDRNGCDTRNDILKRDLKSVTYKGTGCAIASGTLADPYTGTSITFVRGGASEVDIDHVVALGNAWVTGAPKLSYSKRVALANDPLNLLAVDASANRQKGDGDAATWLPANKSFRCNYVARQIGVKAKYGMYVTPAEKEAMQRVLASCPAQLAATGGGSTESGATKPASQPKATTKAPNSASSSSSVDPDYGTCKAANAAGKGPYFQGKDPEYDFYRDNDHDGEVCE